MNWCDNPTRYLLFTGKGGVGKTSLACATAIYLADAGLRVLLVSTDPASNLDDVFGIAIGTHVPTAIEPVPGLHVLNIDPGAAAQAYRERVVGPVRDTLPAMVIQLMEEQLSGACTTEIAAFDEFTELLTNTTETEHFDHVIFDTAPTGHTLRLMKLPTAWSQFLDENQSGTSCLGPLAGLEKQRTQYSDAVETLSDPDATTIILVSRPQPSALAEAARTSQELNALGIANQQLVINGVLPERSSNDPLAKSIREQNTQALSEMPEILIMLDIDYVSLQPRNMVGIEALRSLLNPELLNKELAVDTVVHQEIAAVSLVELVDDIAAEGQGLIMVLGKGGVGKTTIAAAIAVELAERGKEVHLTTTDPAAHVNATVGAQVNHLQVSRIDPCVETENYRAHILKTKGANLDERGRALLEEDLRSPCTEEIAVFQAFSRVIRESNTKFVVLDTAPTGHTLLLLDATGAYHRDVMRHAQADTQEVTPLTQLQDTTQTKLLIVALPETTPVLEAATLQDDLRRAGIEPWAWVINASLAATDTADPLLLARAQQEYAQIDKVQQELASRVAVAPWAATGLVGRTQLLQFMHSQKTTVTKG